MFLFLDVVSPIPEFHVIKDKIIIYSIKIVKDVDCKLSDKIIPTYLEINNTFNLFNNISNLIVTIGPGSYTALRVGASFIAGLSESMNLPVSIISSENIYQYLNNTNGQKGIYFESSNNQRFFSYKKGRNFFHKKIDNDNYILPEFITDVSYNFKRPNFINKKIQLSSFIIKDIVLKNFDRLEFKNNFIIKPLYVSSNSILN